MKAIPLRLKPKQDLRVEIETFCRNMKIHSGCVLTCVGSLSFAKLRMAGGKSLIEKEGPFEILSLAGTISNDGVHLHCSLSDESGQVWGGHLSKGSLIHTTAEIVFGLLEDHSLNRNIDPETGYPELVVSANKD